VLALRRAQQGTDASAWQWSAPGPATKACLSIRVQCGRSPETEDPHSYENGCVREKTDTDLTPLTYARRASRPRLPSTTNCDYTAASGFPLVLRDRRSKPHVGDCTEHTVGARRLTSGCSIRYLTTNLICLMQLGACQRPSCSSVVRGPRRRAEHDLRAQSRAARRK